ncbi:MAG: tRNA (uridine(34)/cytosine(34)/5-carboxymethylaminomethyluridine(34)-2'-O)-methyltransferase TrmL [Candidatus Velthaea sp.]
MSTQPSDRLARLDAVRGAPLHIVLVEPQIPPNTGNVARLCAATGCALHLVEPIGFSIEDRELKRAGLDYWDALNVVVHPSLDAFFEAFPVARCWLLSTHARRTYHGVPYARGDALVFGKETAGLPADLIRSHPTRALRIPMHVTRVRSLNLSTAVGIVAYDALAALGFPDST